MWWGINYPKESFKDILAEPVSGNSQESHCACVFFVDFAVAVVCLGLDGCLYWFGNLRSRRSFVCSIVLLEAFVLEITIIRLSESFVPPFLSAASS